MSARIDNLPSLDAVCALAEEAGQAILEVYAREDFEVECKSDHSPLTAADLASHRLIVDGLCALTPDIPVLSEESADIAWDTRRQWSRYWLVDPLDGTREFVKRNGEFTVNIALIDHHRSVMGVVLAPVTGDLYYASANEGAHARREGKTFALATRKPASPLVVAGSRSHGSGRQAELLSEIGEYTIVAMGSSLKFCLIARGDADLYLRAGLTSEWDTAAAQCVLEQAGGAVTRLDGVPLAYNTKESLLNPEFLAVGDPAVDWSAKLANAT
ncbi:MAG TPA: 3'(2'),5'-bisphosphate nucleotidase CysQ [Oleiagrimonas sp.]|nr:3'(2'),5'-bisphosphate nucleotidase CysQ [Oleiagrimonas sp.]